MPHETPSGRPPAVLAIDLQRDFLEDDGKMPIARGQVAPLIAAANKVIAAAAARGANVVYIGNEFPRSQWLLNLFRWNAAVSGSPGAKMDPRVELASSTYFPKAEGDAFSNRALGAFLRAASVTDVILLGVYAGACVTATARTAMREGYRVTLVREGIGAASDRARERALSRLGRAGARVQSAAEVIARLG